MSNLPILPIDSGRYGTKEMRQIFEEENRLQKMLDVEAALSWALEERGLLPTEDARRISEMASTKFVKLDRVKEIENKIQHDVMAVVEALAEVCGESGALIHYGATSNDINDTATALQFKDAFNVLRGRIRTLIRTLIGLVERHRSTIMIGRTHGQHALPITLGLKLSVWMMELTRHLERLEQCSQRMIVGKITGAVGTQAGFGPYGLEIQSLVMKKLGLRSVEVSTQIVQRDRYAEGICVLAMLASSLEKFATEVRELQRTEIGELAEPFDVKSQVGSSTMPHKTNPMTCERICGLAKLVRGLVIPALENIPNWQERDLTQSSAERFILPSAFILVDYMTALMNKVLSGLVVNPERMAQNMGITQGRFMSESIMLALTKKGMARQSAHQLVRDLSLRSIEMNVPLKEVLLSEKRVIELFSPREMDALLNPKNYLGTTHEQVEGALRKAREYVGE